MKNKGNKFEETVAKCINSGSLWIDKGDLKVGDFLVECKYSGKKSFRITKDIIEKIRNEALDRNKQPRLVIGLPKDDNYLYILTCDIHTIKGEI